MNIPQAYSHSTRAFFEGIVLLRDRILACFRALKICIPVHELRKSHLIMYLRRHPQRHRSPEFLRDTLVRLGDLKACVS